MFLYYDMKYLASHLQMQYSFYAAHSSCLNI